MARRCPCPKPAIPCTFRTHLSYEPSSFLGLAVPQPSSRTPVALLRRPWTGGVPTSVRSGRGTFRSTCDEATAAARQPGTAGPAFARLGCRSRPPLARRGSPCCQPLRGVQRRALALGLGAGVQQGEALGLSGRTSTWELAPLSVRRRLCQAPWLCGSAPTRASGSKPAECSKHTDDSLVTVEPMSARSRRAVHLPARALAGALRLHKRAQAPERLAAGELWWEGSTVSGCSPIRPRPPS